jgi:hypothetical protein
MSKLRFDLNFGVGDPIGRHSGVWKCWSSRNRPDIYVAARTIGGRWKTSIHLGYPGVRHAGLTDEEYQRRVAGGLEVPSTRHADRWKKGAPTSHAAFRVELRVRFPTSQLRAYPCETDSPVLWITAAKEGQAVEVVLVVGLPGHIGTPRVDVGESHSLMHFRLVDGRGAWLLHHCVAEQSFGDEISALRRRAERSGLTADNVKPSHRIFLGGPSSDGGRALVELAADSLFQSTLAELA